MKVILYVRVSTHEQTSTHQLHQAKAAGFSQIDEVVTDHGVSGISSRLFEREGGRRLRDLLREGDTLLVRFPDRLGRNYQDVTEAMRFFLSRGVIIRTVIANLTFEPDGGDPLKMAIRDAMLAFMAASAQSTAEATKEAVKAGIAYARQTNPNAYRGRKITFNQQQLETVQSLLSQGMGISEISASTGLSRGTIYRLKREPEKAVAALERWGI